MCRAQISDDSNLCPYCGAPATPLGGEAANYAQPPAEASQAPYAPPPATPQGSYQAPPAQVAAPAAQDVAPPAQVAAPAAQAVTPANPKKGKGAFSDKTLVLGLTTFFVVVVLGVGIFGASTLLFPESEDVPSNASSESTDAKGDSGEEGSQKDSTDAASQTEAEASTGSEDEGDAKDGEESEATDEEKAAAEKEAADKKAAEEKAAKEKEKKDATVAVKGNLSEYSWQEIATIAKEIEGKAKSKDEAIQMAAKYNLCQTDGRLYGDCKTLSHAARNVDVFIIGIFHDGDASGKPAAFTFMTQSCFDEKPMNETPTNGGGWGSSYMRSWLNGEVLKGMPDGLDKNIRSVVKWTNNVGQTTDPASVTLTEDKLWLFSWRECLGHIAWNTGSEIAYIDAVDNCEGNQYDWFIQQGVCGEQGHPALVRNKVGESYEYVWWMRSSTPNHNDGFGDMGPVINDGANAASYEGVVFGFCL